MLTAQFTTNNLYNRFTKKKQKEECKRKIDVDHVKAAAWDKVIAFMNEILISVAKGFDLHELENICLEYLSEHKIFRVSHITRFG